MADAHKVVDLVLVGKEVLPRVDMVSWRCLMKIKSNCSYSDLFLMHLPVASCIMCTSISSLRLCGVFAALVVTFWSRLWHFFLADSHSFILTGAEETVWKKRGLLYRYICWCFDMNVHTELSWQRALLIKQGLWMSSLLRRLPKQWQFIPGKRPGLF